MSASCETCVLRTELCTVRDQLGPMVAEAEVMHDLATTVEHAAATEARDANEAAGIAVLDAQLGPLSHEVFSEDDELAQSLDLAGAALQAQQRQIEGILSHAASLREVADTDPILLSSGLRRANTNIATLDQVCKKGPNARGDCRAPRAYRNLAREALREIGNDIAETRARNSALGS